VRSIKDIQFKDLPRAWLYVVTLVVILAAFIILQLSLLGRRSMMVDDTIHIPSGYSYLKTHDFRLNEEHPPFIKALSAVGTEHVQPELPLDSEGWTKAAEPGDPDDGTDTFCGDFFHRNADRFQEIIYWARLPVIFVPIVLAVVLWAFARSLFGDLAAILSVFFFLSEPNVIANSNFVQDDISSALALVLFAAALRAYFNKPIFVRAILLGLAIAFGLLVKHSLIVFVPVAIVLLLVHALWRRLRHKEHFCRYLGFALIILGISYVVFLAGYAFDASFIDDDEAVFISEWFYVTGDWSEWFQNILVHLTIVLPKYYLWGMDMVLNDVRNGRPAFLFGEVSQTGWWYYFPAAFVLKTTIAFLVLSVAGMCWTVWKILRQRWLDGLYLLVPSLGYLGFSMMSHLNIGVRHIMPVFPFFAVMGGAAVAALLNVERFKRWHASWILVGVLGVWIIVIDAATFPNYTTYFSPIAGGPSNGWRLLSDSNVETGQDIKDLAAFMKARGVNQIEGLFVGSGYIEYYGVENCDIPCGSDEDDAGNDNDDDATSNSASDYQDPRISYIAIGGWYLEEINLTPEQQEVIDQYRNEQPEAVINNAIFVFRTKPNR
jgi:hypothetical protein